LFTSTIRRRAGAVYNVLPHWEGKFVMIVSKCVWILAGVLFIGCIPQSAAQENITTERILTNTPLVMTPAVTESPIPEPTPVGPQRLVVWWPEPLAPLDDEAAAAVLSAQIRGFEESQEGADVEFRLKQAQDVGGIMETLRTAGAVAPNTLPDLSLIRREDLMTAVQAGLVQPLEGHVSSAIIGDLHASTLALGQADGRLYGLPYALEVQHLAYRFSANRGSTRFESFLAREMAFVFPANRVTGVNDVFLVQYLDAGGVFPDGGTLTINADALRTTLAFYEQAVAAGLIEPVVLDYSAPANYRRELASGAISAAVVTSSQYLDMLAEGQELAYGLIPTLTGQPATVLNGWMWVLTTQNADRQELAAAFLDWMLDAERQVEYNQVIHMLPSQRATLRRLDKTAYSQFVARLLDNATLPLTDSQAGPAARALQNALTAVLLSARTAEEATQDVVDQLAD
jgi:multiple sugar transport system substrate-binding protein